MTQAPTVIRNASWVVTWDAASASHVYRRDPGADAAFAESVEPILSLGRKVAEGGDAALQKLAQRHFVGRPPALAVARK